MYKYKKKCGEKLNIKRNINIFNLYFFGSSKWASIEVQPVKSLDGKVHEKSFFEVVWI